MVIGPNGTVISDITNMKVVIIEGVLIGNVSSDRLIMKGRASLQGDVRCGSVQMGPHTTMIGQMYSLFDPNDTKNVRRSIYHLRFSNIIF